MAERHTTLFGDQIDISAAGPGLDKDTSDNLTVLVDDSTLEIATLSGIGDAVIIKDDGVTTAKIIDDAVTEAKLDALNAPTDTYVLSWDLATGRFNWVSNEVNDVVKEADVIVNEIPSGAIDNANTVYTLASTPVSTTVAVYLNGMRQAPGGLDYTLSGSTVTFVKAPKNNSDLYVDYIIDN